MSERKCGLKPGIFARSVTVVCPLVPAQVGAAGKGSATLQTAIGFLITVGHLVDEQVGALAETLATYTTGIRLLACVSMSVPQQI